MGLRKGLFYAFGCFAFATGGHAQTSGQLQVPSADLRAGAFLQGTLTLDKPADCATVIRVYFQSHGDQFALVGSDGPGKPEVLLSGTLPKDLPGGQYQAMFGMMDPCPGYAYSKRVTVQPVTITVHALPDLDQSPASAKLTLSLTQQQFLDTKVAQLNQLDQQLTTGLEGRAADTPHLRDFLTGIVRSAEEKLDVTEVEYRTHMLKAKDPSPAFFADFRAQYEALLAELRAPIPGAGARVVPLSTPLSAPRLVYAQQLAKRAPKSPGDRPGNLGNTSPAIMTAVRKAINDNAAAYKYVKESGRITFDAVLESYPSDAQIKYKKLIDDTFLDYSGHTKVEKATFELATWIFKFHKDGCIDEPIVRIDPYEDSHPDVYVEFNHCRGR